MSKRTLKGLRRLIAVSNLQSPAPKLVIYRTQQEVTREHS